MTDHSIFARQWWTVCLQTKRSSKLDNAGEAKLQKFIEVIAANMGEKF